MFDLTTYILDKSNRKDPRDNHKKFIPKTGDDVKEDPIENLSEEVWKKIEKIQKERGSYEKLTQDMKKVKKTSLV